MNQTNLFFNKPIFELAEPVPRGHVPSHEGDFGGKIFFDALKQEINSSDIEISCDSRVKGLVINDNNEIVGVAFKKDNLMQYAKLTNVILSAGGFVMNEEMIASYPFQTKFAALGISINIINMDEAFFGVYFYPPESLTNGIFVNAEGKRFVNEDSYGARIGYFCSQQQDQKIYMVIQNEDFNPSIYMNKLPILAVAETIDELEIEAGFEPGSISSTISAYNLFAKNGEDQDFKKDPKWLKEFSKPPFIIDYSFENQASPAYSDRNGPLMFTWIRDIALWGSS